MLGDRHVDDPSSVVGEQDEDEEQPERHCRYHEQVGRHDLARMIGEEGSPRLRRRAWMPPHVLGDRRLTYRNSQLLKFPVNPRRAPERIRDRHLTNQGADVGGYGRAAAISTLPRPEQAKAAPMSCEYRRRLNDTDRRAPATPSLRQPCPEHAISGRQSKAWTARTIRDR
jgi:hypothetical protein